MNLGGKVQLVIVDIFRILPIPFVSKDLDDSLAWNWMVGEYIVVVFDFVEKFWPLMGLSCHFTQMTSKF
jgi:hypothetical protein